EGTFAAVEVVTPLCCKKRLAGMGGAPLYHSTLNPEVFPTDDKLILIIPSSELQSVGNFKTVESTMISIAAAISSMSALTGLDSHFVVSFVAITVYSPG